MAPRSTLGDRFVRETSGDDGIAWCERVEHGMAFLRYVDVPGVNEESRRVPASTIRPALLSAGTRVWVPSRIFGWLPGQITASLGYERYQVRIAGLAGEIPLPSAKFRVRWRRPLTDPVAALANGVCDSPEFYEARREFRDELVRQRSTSRGYAGVVSAPVDLFHHQLDTVARVLSDPVLRYLLADEVGLGKTIEAGLILRQVLLDDPSASALIGVPSELAGQWTVELKTRLLLGAALDSGRISVVSHQQLGRQNLRTHGLVVVDEAHRLLRDLRTDERLRLELLHAKGLLLLSATPIRGNLEDFLDLLNLIDEYAFPRDNVASFRARLDEREREAGDLRVLTSARASVRQRRSVLRDLLARHGADPIVVRLSEECGQTEDLGSPKWAELESYVREVYRISRRVIRHRRRTAATEDYPIAGRRPSFVELLDPARPVIDSFLDQYRELAAPPAGAELYPELVEHAIGGPTALGAYLDSLLTRRPEPPNVAAFRGLLQTMAARLRLAATNARLKRAAEVVEARLDDGLRVVVVASSTETAQAFLDLALSNWPRAVGSHLRTDEQSKREGHVANFLRGPDGRVLVGDSSLEEGRNLQDADVLINLDLPLDVNRLEQRIGRLDRFARRQSPSEIVVFEEPDSDWVTGHIRLLRDGAGVFAESVATQQRRLALLNGEIRQRLWSHGSRAFDVDVDELREDLARERLDIDMLEEIESISAGSDFDEAAVAELRRVDADVAPLRSALLHLTSLRGGIGLRPVEDAARHTWQFGAAGEVITGISEEEAASVRPFLRRPRALRRDVAATANNVAPLRIGDPLVDWLQSFLASDERGRVRAFLRHADVGFPSLWLSCDFLIEFDASHLAVADGATRRRLARRGDALFQPHLVSTWTNATGPAPKRMLDLLEPPFVAEQDLVLRGPLWTDVLEELPDWKREVTDAGHVAVHQVQMAPVLTTHPNECAARAQRELDARVAVLRARSHRLPSEAERRVAEQEMEREESVGKALVRGVEAPATSLIACGAVVLWPRT